MTRQHLLLLHGALGASDQFAPVVPLLRNRYEVHLLDFEGHGAAPLQPRPFRIEHFASNAYDYLVRQGIEGVCIFGYSMGGYVGCTLAMQHPQLVHRIATLGTKYFWDQEVARREVGYLDVDKIAAKVPHFAQALAERHTAAGWETVANHTADLLWSLAERSGLRAGDLAGLEQPVRVMVGDRDSTVSVAEAHEVYKALPHGELEVLPGTRHELDRVSPERLVYSLTQFFS
jgi:pimeloyl-ACP methyl ester carboxylesterase